MTGPDSLLQWVSAIGFPGTISVVLLYVVTIKWSSLERKIDRLIYSIETVMRHIDHNE